MAFGFNVSSFDASFRLFYPRVAHRDVIIAFRSGEQYQSV